MIGAATDLMVAERHVEEITVNLNRWKAILIFLECSGHTGQEVEVASELLDTLNEGVALAHTLLARERARSEDEVFTSGETRR